MYNQLHALLTCLLYSLFYMLPHLAKPFVYLGLVLSNGCPDDLGIQKFCSLSGLMRQLSGKVNQATYLEVWKR